MSEVEILSRKKKMSGTHCSSVTCMIMQVEELLHAEPEELNVSQLKQKCQALVGKTELLTKLAKQPLRRIVSRMRRTWSERVNYQPGQCPE